MIKLNWLKNLPPAYVNDPPVLKSVNDFANVTGCGYVRQTELRRGVINSSLPPVLEEGLKPCVFEPMKELCNK